MPTTRPAEMAEMTRQLKGYRLTTAEILYRLPDRPVILQSFVWQAYDIAPRFPELRKFLDFWDRELDGKLHSVRVAAVDLIKAPAWQPVDGLYTLQ